MTDTREAKIVCRLSEAELRAIEEFILEWNNKHPLLIEIDKSALIRAALKEFIQTSRNKWLVDNNT